jgi:hypothetical protein
VVHHTVWWFPPLADHDEKVFLTTERDGHPWALHVFTGAIKLYEADLTS